MTRQAEPVDGNSIAVREAVEALAQAMVVWDQDNYDHCVRSSEYAEAIAREMGIGDEAAEEIRLGALLHDIGKIGVELSVFKKPGELEAIERERVRLHPEMGASILGRVLPEAIVECAAAHHEQPDGGGYPRGIAGDDIPLAALICRVADVLDSLTTAQTYRPALTLDDALAELRKGAGTRYGERAVGALVALIERNELRPAS